MSAAHASSQSERCLARLVLLWADVKHSTAAAGAGAGACAAAGGGQNIRPSAC